MSDVGVLDPSREMSMETGNQLSSYINLVQRLNSQKKKAKSGSMKRKG